MITYERLPGQPQTRRVVVSMPEPAIVGYIRRVRANLIVARTAGDKHEAADIRRFSTSPDAVSWLVSRGHRKAA